jgi:hypothetical protein
MKNIVNYLDEFIDEENGIYECSKKRISDMKDHMKKHKKKINANDDNTIKT